MTALATLETRMELEPKCVTHLFPRSFMGTCLSAIGRDAITSLIGDYEVAWETGSKFLPPLNKQSHSAIQHNTDQLSRYTSK